MPILQLYYMLLNIHTTTFVRICSKEVEFATRNLHTTMFVSIGNNICNNNIKHFLSCVGWNEINNSCAYNFNILFTKKRKTLIYFLYDKINYTSYKLCLHGALRSTLVVTIIILYVYTFCMCT